MKKTTVHAAFVLVILLLLLSGCGRNDDTAELPGPASDTSPESSAEVADEAESRLSDEQALAAIKNYCRIKNPELESIVNAGEYPVYWDVFSSDEDEIVILFRSYTGAQERYHIDRLTGETYVTEFVPGITAEEERTDESLNAREYLPEE